MTEGTTEKIRFAVEVSRMIELLASQIYPSPFALLRENIQNSFDATLLRRHMGQTFNPTIEVTIEPTMIRVADNGVGMSRHDLRNHFWRAGSSSKNTPQARAAGVVGTFGIGAMANFGIAEELTVITESASSGERTWCQARRSTLSVTEDCIEFRPEPSTGQPGTEVTAAMQAGKVVNVQQAIGYIKEFVAFLPIPVRVNGTLVSQDSMESSIPPLTESWAFRQARVDIGTGLKADVELTGAITGQVRINLSNLEIDQRPVNGRIILLQGKGTLQTFRSLFGLATTSVSSVYQFGGVADLPFLEPTAGREALTTGSTHALQRIVGAVDDFVSLRLSERPESNANLHFATWVAQRGRYELCSYFRVRVEPNDSATLAEIRRRSEASPVLVYAGSDSEIIGHASEDRRIVVPTYGSPRHGCELNFLRLFCKIEELTDAPTVRKVKRAEEWSLAESGLAFRIVSILSADYFLAAEVRFGSISHRLPMLVTRRSSPIEIYLDPNGQTVRLLVDLYEREYGAFGHMAKDFVRTVIFPHVSDLVPSATRQGAEAFLNSIQRNREVFEYESADLESLKALLKDLFEGRVTLQEAAQRSNTVASRTYQVIDSGTTAPIREVVPDVIDNEATLQETQETGFDPMPPIQRLDIETQRKLLTIGEDEAALKGYRCFLAISDRVRDEKGDFFLQPHRTSVVWGGQRALFVFEHHSGEFGLYYDVQTPDLVSHGSGGGSFQTCTIVTKNRIFIPLPEAIQASFIPQPGEKKRLEVRCDILYLDRPERP